MPEQLQQQDLQNLQRRPCRPVEHMIIAGIVAVAAQTHNTERCGNRALARGEYCADQQHLHFHPSLPSATIGGPVLEQRCEGKEDGYNCVRQGKHGLTYCERWS